MCGFTLFLAIIFVLLISAIALTQVKDKRIQKQVRENSPSPSVDWDYSARGFYDQYYTKRCKYCGKSLESFPMRCIVAGLDNQYGTSLTDKIRVIDSLRFDQKYRNLTVCESCGGDQTTE